MANRGKSNGSDFRYFGWDENPKDKYTQPKPNPNNIKGSGYPQTDIEKDGTFVHGKMPANTPTKQRMEMRGKGAAERGTKFMIDDRVYDETDQ